MMGNGKILSIYQRHLKRLSGYKQYRGTPTFTEELGQTPLQIGLLRSGLKKLVRIWLLK